MSFLCSSLLFSDAQCPVLLFVLSLPLGLVCLQLFIFTFSLYLSTRLFSSLFLSLFSLHSFFQYFFFSNCFWDFFFFLPLFWFVCFYVFSSSPPCWFVFGYGVCPLASCCSKRLSLVSGSGLCPPRPSSPRQVAQEHFLGRYSPPHVCAPPHLRSQKSPGVVRFLSLAQYSGLQHKLEVKIDHLVIIS